MNKIVAVIILFLGLTSCKENTTPKTKTTNENANYIELIAFDYQLYKPVQKAKAVLILFGGFPENAEDIKREFKILELAKLHNIAVIFSNYNRKIWLETQEKHKLAAQLQKIIADNQLPTDAIYIGGFSSGGVVSLLLSDFIVSLKQYYIDPKGVFIVDSPIDLAALYTSSEKNVQRTAHGISNEESIWILETLNNAFGHPDEHLDNYEKNAVYTSRSNYTGNVKHLKKTKIRLYTEPDTLWWKTNHMADYDQMNAYYIKKISQRLKEQEFKNVEYIPTTNKGYRENGDRHPHSWSIIDTKDLVDWILED